MANSFGTDILIQATDIRAAATFYVEQLGFQITEESPQMISIHGENINMFIEQGPPSDLCSKSRSTMWRRRLRVSFRPGAST